MQLTPYICVEIEGLNQIRLLNSLKDNDINIYKLVKSSPKLMRFTLSKKDGKKAVAVFKKLCYNYTIISEQGVKPLLKNALRHIGLYAGVIVFTAAILLSNSLVLKVNVEGNTNVSTHLIMRELKSGGIKVGARKSTIDKQAVASLLRGIDGIIEGSVELDGSKVIIKVIEEKEHLAPNEDNIPRDLVSGYDAEITRVVVKKGTPQVKVGDTVRAGNILIKGEVYNTNGEPLEAVRAEGEVYGKVAFKTSHVFSDRVASVRQTGKKQVSTELSIFGLKIKGKKPSGLYNTVTEETKLFFLPIKVKRSIFYEVKAEIKDRDIDEYVEQYKQDCILRDVIKAGGSNVEALTTLTPMDGGMYMLNVYVVGEMLLNGGIYGA